MAENSSFSAVKTEIGTGLPASISCDMEEGELPDSDDEINSKQEVKEKVSQTYTSFRQSSYRTTTDTDDDDSDSDDENLWKRKKQKVFQQPKMEYVQDDVKPPRIAKRTVSGKKVNNIWGSVMEEQNQDLVSSRLTSVGLDFSSNRGVESYNHNRCLDTEQAHLPLGAHGLARSGGRDIPQAVGGEDDLFTDYIEPFETDEKNDKEDKNDVEGNMENDVEEGDMKQSARQRLGKRPVHLPSVVAKKIDIDPNEGIKAVAGNIAYSLWETKRHLVLKTVEMIGIEKSIEIYNKAIEIEESGGMLINNKQRRRSPGGVFFYLLRNSYGIEKPVLDEIFEADVEYPRNGHKVKKNKKKRKQPSNKDMEVTEND